MTLTLPQRAVSDTADRTRDANGAAVSRYDFVRNATEALCQSLVPEDYVIQSMPDVSPTKWHLAHTSWFFETFILSRHLPDYPLFDPNYAYLFNSYYVTVGDRHCRQNRGLLSRPTVADVFAYRRHVDRHMRVFLQSRSAEELAALEPLLAIGLHHEQQHQELMVTDIKHVFWVNPLRPAFRSAPEDALHPPGTAGASDASRAARWIKFEGGLREIGHDPSAGGFYFDNESPRHPVYLQPFELASRLVTNREWKAFIDDGGYDRAELWLSAGIAMATQEQWRSPLYWIQQDGAWQHHTLWGLRPVEDDLPVCHISFFEADAFARWSNARLPTEPEWEIAAEGTPLSGTFVESERFHPAAAGHGDGLLQMFGDAWQWTGSAYLGYPGYRPPAGALGEYNGKFMCNQFVLRGGSCATPRSHIRRTYRNFFPPDARWQFSGFRLARDL